MMTPKQKPVSPAPPMAPSCAPVKPNCAAHVARMPPRIAKPMPVASMARKPAHKRRWAFGAVTSALRVALLIVVLFRPAAGAVGVVVIDGLSPETNSSPGRWQRWLEGKCDGHYGPSGPSRIDVSRLEPAVSQLG